MFKRLHFIVKIDYIKINIYRVLKSHLIIHANIQQIIHISEQHQLMH